MIEYAPTGKSADEIRSLWHWVETKLQSMAAETKPVLHLPEIVPLAAFLHEPVQSPELASQSWGRSD